MKTYHQFQHRVFSTLLFTLLCCLPLYLSAADDCKSLLKEAEKLDKAIDKLEDKVSDAEIKLNDARDARDKAQAQLDDYNNPQDPGVHGPNVTPGRRALEKALEKAESKLMDAKADYYDALQELIDQLNALKALLDKADRQCETERKAADSDRLINKLKDYEDKLDEIRDRKNLETRDGDPEEPANTQKKQDELVDAELKALLERILKALKAENPDPEDYRSALRKKRQEIRNEWDDGFWDTPLGKLLKALLDKALEAELNPSSDEPPTDDPSQDTEEEESSAEEPAEEGAFRSIPQNDQGRFGLGFSFGINKYPVYSRCAPEQSGTATDQISVITVTDPALSGPTTDLQTDGNTGMVSHFETTPTDNSLLCLDQWIAQPEFGIFLDIGLGKQWAAGIGAYRQEFKAVPLSSITELIRADGTISRQTNTLDGRLEHLELQAGILRFFGKHRLRPVLGVQATFRQISGTANHSMGQNLETSSWDDRGWGTRTLAGIRWALTPNIELGVQGQWQQFFAPNDTKTGAGGQVQLIWHP